jgi:cysteine desulfurase
MIRVAEPTCPIIYLDYQGSTPIDPQVASVIVKYYTEYAANPHAADHAAGWAAGGFVEEATKRLGRSLGCDGDEIVFTSGATEANNLAILGVAERAKTDRRRILISAIEHKSVVEAAQLAQRRYGCRVELIPVDDEGVIRCDALQELLRDDVLLVSVMAVNNEVGSLQPLVRIAELAKQNGALVHSDATHALACGWEELGLSVVDLASLSGHKIYGPKGIGALIARREVQPMIAPQIVGGGQQNGIRAGTVPMPLCMGLAHAAEMLSGQRAEIERSNVAELRNYLAAKLLESCKSHLVGPKLSDRHPGNLNLRFDGLDAQDILARLQPNIAASTGSACTSGTPEPSHVLLAIGLSPMDASSCIRFSLGRFTTRTEIDDAVAWIRRQLASMDE